MTVPAAAEEKEVACVMQGDKPIPIIAMYESYTNWYWFITERDPNDPNYLFGLVCGFENEWGYIDKRELESIKSIWPVPKINWSSNSHVVMIPESKLLEEGHKR